VHDALDNHFHSKQVIVLIHISMIFTDFGRASATHTMYDKADSIAVPLPQSGSPFDMVGGLNPGAVRARGNKNP
jgi:hypothetical protein